METIVNQTIHLTDDGIEPNGRGININTPCRVVSEAIDDTYVSGKKVTIVCEVAQCIDYSDYTEEQVVVIDSNYITYK